MLSKDFISTAKSLLEKINKAEKKKMKKEEETKKTNLFTQRRYEIHMKEKQKILYDELRNTLVQTH